MNRWIQSYTINTTGKWWMFLTEDEIATGPDGLVGPLGNWDKF